MYLSKEVRLGGCGPRDNVSACNGVGSVLSKQGKWW
jgi:hypothetical protein